MLSTWKTGLIAGLACFVVPSIALAQETPPPAPPPTEPPPVTPAAPAKPAEQPPPPNDGHFRWGLSPMFGTFFPGPTTIALGFEGRFGYALNQTVTVYGNVAAVGGVGFGADVMATGGTQKVVTGTTAIGISPLLHIGFDSR